MTQERRTPLPDVKLTKQQKGMLADAARWGQRAIDGLEMRGARTLVRYGLARAFKGGAIREIVLLRPTRRGRAWLDLRRWSNPEELARTGSQTSRDSI